MQVYFNSITFLRCVDSQIEENKLWYSQFHIGPFTKGNSLMFSTRLRRTLINNLSQTSILRIKFEGASNEFSRLPGIQEPVMDLIFQFRKVTLNAFFFDIGTIQIVPFSFTGPNIIYAKNITWPYSFYCSTPKILLFTLSPKTVFKGQLLVQKYQIQKLPFKLMQVIQIGKPWRSFTKKNTNLSDFCKSVWIRVGTPKNLIRRAGFRIESLEHLSNQIESILFEITTSGRTSPREVLKNSSIILVSKFRDFIYTMSLPVQQTPQNKNTPSYDKENTFYQLFRFDKNKVFSCNVENLDLNFQARLELQNFGIITVGELIEDIAFNQRISEQTLKLRQQALFFRI